MEVDNMVSNRNGVELLGAIKPIYNVSENNKQLLNCQDGEFVKSVLRMYVDDDGDGLQCYLADMYGGTDSKLYKLAYSKLCRYLNIVQ